jgi:hypothetical protein
MQVNGGAMKKMVLATLAYAVVTMLIAAPWHFVLFKDLYHSFGIYNREDPIVPLGFLTMTIQGLVMACIYPRYYRGGSHFREAIRFSLLMGFFLYSVSTLANAAKIEVSPMGTWLGIQGAFHVVQFVACGLALGFVYSRK